MGKHNNEKVPKLYAAKRALIAYIKDHNIDPSDTKRIQTDPKLRELVYKLNKERDKVMANYPALDKSNNIKLLKMAKEDKKAKKAKKKVKEVESTSTTKTKKQGRTATKYDYPQVKDEKTGKMRDMTPVEKKKYRMEQRKAANGGTTSKNGDKATKEAPVENKKKKASKEEKSSKKKTKKVKKEED